MKTDGGQTTGYVYDDLGALMEVTLPDGTDVDYAVDAGGRRIAKKVDGVLAQGLLYGQGIAPLAELNPNGSVKSRFVYATRSNVPDYIVQGADTYRVLVDQLGSPRTVVDAATGVVVQEMDFDEFGRVIRDTNPGLQPFGYAGGLYDPDTGLVRFGARDYDPDSGRFTAKDPIGFAGGDTNLYGYVLADPINWIDPSGLIGLPSFADVSDFAAGFGDTVTFGLTQEIRQFGYYDNVDYCSSAYSSDGWTGIGTSLAVGVGGAAARLTWRGGELRFAQGSAVPRVAPLGHRSRYGAGVLGQSNGSLPSRLPHYHARGRGGTAAHRPWEGGVGRPWRR